MLVGLSVILAISAPVDVGIPGTFGAVEFPLSAVRLADGEDACTLVSGVVPHDSWHARSHPTPPRTLGLVTSTRLAAEVPTGCQRRVVSGGSTPTSIPSSALSVVSGSLTVVFGYIQLRATPTINRSPRHPSLSAFSWSADRDHRVLMIAGTDALSPVSS